LVKKVNLSVIELMLNNEKNKLTGNELTSEESGADQFGDNTNHPVRRRRRVKIRKRIRIKQKPSTKKLIKKIAVRLFWIIIIGGFITSLIIMIIQLDVRDEKYKQQRKKVTPIRVF
jgi:hypothetical protein